MRYAIVDNDVVLNVIILDDPADYPVAEALELVALEGDDEAVSVGWERENGIWRSPVDEVPPPPAPAPPVVVGENGTSYAITVDADGQVIATPVAP